MTTDPENTPESVTAEKSKPRWGRRLRLGALAIGFTGMTGLMIGMHVESNHVSDALDTMLAYEHDNPFLSTIDTTEEIAALTPEARAIYDHDQDLLDDFLGHAETAAHLGMAALPTVLVLMAGAVPNMYSGGADFQGVIDWWVHRRSSHQAVA